MLKTPMDIHRMPSLDYIIIIRRQKVDVYLLNHYMMHLVLRINDTLLIYLMICYVMVTRQLCWDAQ